MMRNILLTFVVFCACGCLYAQNNSQQSIGAEKTKEMFSAININKLQKAAIEKAMEYRMKRLNAIDTTITPKERAFKKYEIEKSYHEKMMRELSDKQIAEYCKIVFAPEITAKTDYKMSLLLEVENNYSEEDIMKMREEIYNYLMLEKIVYFKYKYDYAKQKNNISRLKGIQPTSLKSSNNIEKQKGYGKLVCGKINWK